jgi:hypothetical protein
VSPTEDSSWSNASSISRARARKERTSGVGQGDVAGGAVEQADAETIFEARHQLGDLGGRNSEAPGGLGEAAGVGHGGKSANFFNAIHGSAIISKLEIHCGKTQGLSTDAGTTTSNPSGMPCRKPPKGNP